MAVITEDEIQVKTRKPRANVTTEGQSPELEAFLKERGVKFEFLSNVRPARFDLERSLRNQARVGVPINKETARRYVEAINNGDTFPAVLASEDGTAFDAGGKLLVLDGNHRLVAHNETGQSLNVYICHGDPQALAWLSFEANARHGLPSSEEDRVNHAIWLIENGVSFAEARQRLAVPQTALRRALASHQSDRRADEVGILRRDWEAIPASARHRLANINTDEGLRAAMTLVKDAGLLSEEVFELVAKLNETRSGTRQEAYVRAIREGMEDRINEVRLGGAARKGKRRVSSPKGALAMSLGQVNALPPASLFEQLPSVEKQDIVKKVREGIERLRQIEQALVGEAAS